MGKLGSKEERMTLLAMATDGAEAMGSGPGSPQHFNSNLGKTQPATARLVTVVVARWRKIQQKT